MSFLCRVTCRIFALVVRACSFDNVSNKLKELISKDSKVVARKALKALGKSKPKLYYRMMVMTMRAMHRQDKIGCELDSEYWINNDLLKGSFWNKKSKDKVK